MKKCISCKQDLLRQGTDAMQQNLPKKRNVCPSSIFNDLKKSEESSNGPSENNDFSYSSMIGTGLVPRVAMVINKLPILIF